MSQQTINIGATANDGTGDQLRTAFDKVNDNFVEIYTELGGASLSNVKITGNTISTDDTNGNLTLDPNGTGTIVLANATTASSTLTVTGALTATSSVTFASMTTVQRDALTEVTGMVIFNTTTTKLQVCTDGAVPTWADLH
jgi:hypothetical protein